MKHIIKSALLCCKALNVQMKYAAISLRSHGNPQMLNVLNSEISVQKGEHSTLAFVQVSAK